MMKDHFDKQFELESTLRKRGKSVRLTFLEGDLPGAGQKPASPGSKNLWVSVMQYGAPGNLVGHAPLRSFAAKI